jgi:predicted nucleic acid-binding protein
METIKKTAKDLIEELNNSLDNGEQEKINIATENIIEFVRQLAD